MKKRFNIEQELETLQFLSRAIIGYAAAKEKPCTEEIHKKRMKEFFGIFTLLFSMGRLPVIRQDVTYHASRLMILRRKFRRNIASIEEYVEYEKILNVYQVTFKSFLSLAGVDSIRQFGLNRIQHLQVFAEEDLKYLEEGRVINEFLHPCHMLFVVSVYTKEKTEV